jgi:hypothetical protein
MRREEFVKKYKDLEENGFRLFTVTLSTYLKSDSIARSDRMRHMWDEHFISRIDKRMTISLKNSFAYDWIVEESRDNYYHYHGVMAFKPEAADRIWSDGALHKELQRDLQSFRIKGTYRPFRINAFEIKPIHGTSESWTLYMTKQWDTTPASSFR